MKPNKRVERTRIHEPPFLQVTIAGMPPNSTPITRRKNSSGPPRLYGTGRMLGVKSAFVKESEATDRLMRKHGPVTAMRLLGYLYKLDTEGEEWLYEHISRQQLNHVKATLAEAGVPFERGAIKWPALAEFGKKLARHRDRV